MILDCTRDTCFGISRHAHFKNFGYALLTLFRVSTGDNWSGLLKVKNAIMRCFYQNIMTISWASKFSFIVRLDS